MSVSKLNRREMMNKTVWYSAAVCGILTVALVLAASMSLSCSGQGPACAGKLKLSAKDFSMWRSPAGWRVVGNAMIDKAKPKMLKSKPGTGVLINGPVGKAKDLISKKEFGDQYVHVEFMISSGSNSGVYIQGQYEIQIADSWRWRKSPYPGSECGGIYERWDENRSPKGYEGYSPHINAALSPGKWQSFDIFFRAARFDANGKKIANARIEKIIHNGIVIHENVELTGPTRGSMFAEDVPLGPLRLQGDHGPVAYRNVWICPLN